MGKISIVITCFNLGQYLREAIDSIKACPQDFIKETVIIDDGSNDPVTTEVLRTLEDEGWKVVHQHNQGLGTARNNGIRFSSGDYIIPLDADNKLKPEMIIKSVHVLNENPEIDVVYGDSVFFGEKSGRQKIGPFKFQKLLVRNYIDACACFRKSAWEKVGGYDEKMPVMGVEDWDLWLRMSCYGMQFKYVDEIFFDYRVRENSMLQDTVKRIQPILDHMFSKPSLAHLKELRESYIRLTSANYEPSIAEILLHLRDKINRKLRLSK